MVCTVNSFYLPRPWNKFCDNESLTSLSKGMSPLVFEMMGDYCFFKIHLYYFVIICICVCLCEVICM